MKPRPHSTKLTRDGGSLLFQAMSQELASLASMASIPSLASVASLALLASIASLILLASITSLTSQASLTRAGDEDELYWSKKRSNKGKINENGFLKYSKLKTT